jgi:hypothetical protein
VDIVNFKLPFTVGLKKYYYYNYAIPSPPGAAGSSQSFLYDGNGNLTQQNSFTGNLATQTAEDDYTYNSNGQITRDDYYPWAAVPGPGVSKQPETSYTTYAYDSNGNLVLQSYFNGTTLSSQNTYEYDSTGNLTRQSYFSPAGTLSSYNSYSYDANGHMTTQTYTNVSSPSSDASYTYEWDPTTHFISKLTYTYGSGSFSEVIQFASGTLSVSLYTGSTYGGGSTLTFDANGLETVQASLNASGTMTNSDEFQYDISGRQTEFNSYSYPGKVQTNRETWSY